MSICLTILPKAVNSPYDAIQPAYKFFPFSAFGFHIKTNLLLEFSLLKKTNELNFRSSRDKKKIMGIIGAATGAVVGGAIGVVGGAVILPAMV